MPKQRSELEAAAGQLILAIQKEWNREMGEGSVPESEAVMHKSHRILQAAKANEIASLLGEQSVAQFLGESWVGLHPRVISAAGKVQFLVTASNRL